MESYLISYVTDPDGTPSGCEDEVKEDKRAQRKVIFKKENKKR